MPWGWGQEVWGIHVLLFRDPHPMCTSCRGQKCSVDVTCDICKEWSVAQWDVFLKKRRKSHASSSSLPSAPLPTSSVASASSEAGHHSPSLQPSSRPSEGSGVAERSGGVTSVALVVPPLPHLALVREGGGGVLAPSGEGGSVASSLSGGGWRAEPTRSLESTVLVRSAPPSIDSSALADPRSLCCEAGGSSEGRSHSHSSRAFLSHDRESRDEGRRARSRSARSRDWSLESLSRSTDDCSRSRGRVCSRRIPSRSPAAH